MAANEQDGHTRARQPADAAQAQSQSRRRLLESLIDNVPLMVFVKDADELRFVRVNRAGEELLGVTNDDLVGKNDYDFFPQDEADFFTAKDREVLRQGRLLDIPAEPIETREHGTRILHTRKIPLLDEAGHPAYLLGISEDITERVDAERALRESEARFRQLAESIDEVFMLTTTDPFAFLYVNPAFETVFGFDRNEVFDNPLRVRQAIHPDDRARIIAIRERAAQPGEPPYDLEYRIVRPDGDVRWVRSRSAAVNVDEGPPRRAVLLEDVTFAREARESLRAAEASSKAANDAKSVFLSRMSHELRTPLNAILGFGQLLELESLTEDQHDSVGQILKGGRLLLELIDEVLDISRIETGQLSFSLEPVRLADVVGDALELLRPIATARQITLPVETPVARSIHVRADRQRLQQVVLNLVSNAIKYNRPGGSVDLHAAVGPGDELVLEVSDTGIGISANDLTRLFTPFERLSAANTEVEGTGLGLALCKSLVEAMGGRIGARSVLGTGSTLWIELPTVEAPTMERIGGDRAPRIASPTPTDAPTQTILYIEDNLSNVRLVEGILGHRPDVRLIVAMQAGLGLELAREHQPDLILLDLNLPDMPGDEALVHIRRDRSLATVRVVIVSADATPAQISRLRAAGADDYLTKPFDVLEFLRVVDGAP